MATSLSGILPVIPTPFQDDGGVDADAMARLVNYAINSGVDGLVFPGFASEVEHLSPEERRDLLGVVVREAASKAPVIAGASAETPEDVIKHGQIAAEMGVQWLMIQPPKSIGSNAAPVIAFFAQISTALPDARIILQNAPAPRGSDLSPETILDVARAVPQITYVKEETLPSGPAISEIMAHKPDTLLGAIGGGGARYILDEYARGACAAMPAIEISGEHVELDHAWRTGNRDLAREIYIKTLPLLALQAVYRMRLTKHVMIKRGVLENTIVRAPTPELDELAAADIDANLVELGILKRQEGQGT